MFMYYRPNTNLGHGGSIIFQSECQVRYLMGALQALRSRGSGTSIECKKSVFDAYNKSANAQIDKTVWGDAGCTSWYKTKDGRVVNNTPWTLLKYFALTKAFAPEDFVIRPSESAKDVNASASATAATARL